MLSGGDGPRTLPDLNAPPDRNAPLDRNPAPDRKIWVVTSADPELVRSLAAHLGCPTAIAHLLVSRGIGSAAEAEAFFHPSIDHLHAPDRMLGMKEAVDRIQSAVRDREPILIYGDYDVDGTTATVLLKTAIDRMAVPGEPTLVTWHVPHRIREGYGMQAGRLAEAATAGIRLVISVDTGIRAFAAAAEARSLGMDLIVTDHHLPDGMAGVPEAVAVLNPSQPGCPYPSKSLCGAAVAFKLAHALLLAHARAQPDAAAAVRHLNTRILPSFLKLVAIATVADAVPLTGENRVLASLGLRELAHPVQPGLRALMRVADLPPDRAPTSAEVGFRIAPRINAAGRMDVADDVIELFLTRSPERAEELAAKLDGLNQDRRTTEREALDAIEEHLRTLVDGTSGEYPAETLVLDHPDWHRGVLGILASRVVDRTARPALVLTHQDGAAHGSGRSVPGFHLLDALAAAHAGACDQAPAATLFHRFGGHAHAVGFSLRSEHVGLLRDRLREHGAAILTGPVLRPPRLADAEVLPDALSGELAEWLARCAPFGNAHPEPTFMTRGLTLSGPVRLIKDLHLCLQLTSASGGPAIQAIAWSRPGQPRSVHWPTRASELALGAGSVVDVLYRLRPRSDQWFSGLELEIVDLQTSERPGPVPNPD